MPIVIIKLLSTILLSTYKNGIIRILKAVKDPRVPLLPYFISGMNTNHTNRMELIGYNDQVNALDIATSQIAQTIIPTNSNIEIVIDNTFWKDIFF